MSAHMRGALCTIASTAIGDDNRQWIEVMPVADQARNGSFYFTVTRDDLETYAKSIEDAAGKIPIDYDHAAFDGGSSRAAGWFTGQARVVDNADLGAVLEAEVEWTPRAAQEIRDGEYRFTSAEFSFAKKDSKTGLLTEATRIKASTLTNRPFFRELAAIAADDGPVLWDADQGVNQLQTDLAEALNPGASNYDAIRYWVIDVDAAGKRALVCEAGPGDDTWIVPFQRDANDNITIPPSSDWIPVEQAWVADADSDDAAYAHAITLELSGQLLANVVFAAQNAEIEACTSGDTSGYQAKDGNTCHTHDGTPAGIGKAKQAAMRDAMKQAAAAAALTTGGSAATTQEDHVSDTLKALAVDLGLPEDATDEQITEAVKTAKASADRTTELEQELETVKASAGGNDRVVAVDKEKYEQLERNAELGVTAHRMMLQTEADELVATAADDGRIAPSDESRASWRSAILPDGATELVKAEVDALASLKPGRIPVADRVAVAADELHNNQLDTVRAHLGLKHTATV